jgi:aminomethyltransferase
MRERPKGAEEVSCSAVSFTMNLSGKRAVSGQNSEKPDDRHRRSKIPQQAAEGNLSGTKTEEDDSLLLSSFFVSFRGLHNKGGKGVKRTPLYDMHVRLGGRLIDFGGWELPVQYAGILEEHEQTRNHAGLFDVSHMGEIEVRGPEAEAFIQQLVTNDIGKMEENQVVYSPMCYLHGGTVDDLLVYKYSKEHYLLVVNASNTDKDYQWIHENLSGKVGIQNVSEQYAQLALQGPGAEAVLQKLTDLPLHTLRFFRFLPELTLAGVNALVSRTGYTGEDGFEIYVSSPAAPGLWEKLLEAGKEEGLVPVGLGARDTLRFEAVLPLYGQELAQDISPLEAGLGIFVKLGKGDFIGREALVKQKEQGLARQLVGFEMLDKGIARSHYEVQRDGKTIGMVTSGTFSPTLKKNLGLALLEKEFAEPGTELEILVRNKPLKAVVVKKPFYVKRYWK